MHVLAPVLNSVWMLKKVFAWGCILMGVLLIGSLLFVNGEQHVSRVAFNLNLRKNFYSALFHSTNIQKSNFSDVINHVLIIILCLQFKFSIFH